MSGRRGGIIITKGGVLRVNGKPVALMDRNVGRARTSIARAMVLCI